MSYDWNFVTTPQAGAANRKIHYARGKGVGGTSHRNFSTHPLCRTVSFADMFEVIYQRPTSDSFEYWVNATNGTDSPGWSWNDVYPVGFKGLAQLHLIKQRPLW
jgi:choline dehydrogenase-like flavoprotein